MCPSGISRRTVLRGAALGMAALASKADTLFSELPHAPPNIVFILADDLGYADVSCYGRPDLQTRRISIALRPHGVRFLQAYANSAVCSATRTALITGRYQYRLRLGLEEPLGAGNTRSVFPPEHPTLPSLLKKAGYGTTLVGKWHLGLLPEFGPLQERLRPLLRIPQRRHRLLLPQGTDQKDDLWDDDIQVRSGRLRLPSCLESRAVDVVNGYAKARQPFLLSLHFNAPHWPWEGPGDEAESRAYPATVGSATIDGGTQKTYQRMIEDLDSQIGRVLQALARQWHRLTTPLSSSPATTAANASPIRGRSLAERPSFSKADCAFRLSSRWPGAHPDGPDQQPGDHQHGLDADPACRRRRRA